jgi:CRP-like cAMP-binding protein
MMKTELARLIQRKTALTEEELASILKCFKWVKVNKHEHLLEQGEVADQLFLFKKAV